MLKTMYSVSMNAHPGKGELTVLFAGCAQTKPGHHVGPQILDYHLVHCVQSGRGSFHCLGREYHLEAGDCFIIFPGELISYTADSEEPWQYRWVALTGHYADELFARCGITATSPVIKQTGRKLPVWFRQIQKVLQPGRPENDLQAGGLLRLVFGHWMSLSSASRTLPSEAPETEINRQVNQAIRWLTLQYAQPVSIDRLAQSLGYHRTHLSKIFKKHTGMSPMHFLLEIRMERAKLLLQKPLTVEEVASSVGFADPLYFSRQFKKWHGCSPTEFRADMQGKSPYDTCQ